MITSPGLNLNIQHLNKLCERLNMDEEQELKRPFKKQRSDYRTNPIRPIEIDEALPFKLKGNFDAWLASLDLDHSTNNSLRLIHASASNDLAQIRVLLQQGILPVRICVVNISQQIMVYDYAFYFNSSPFHWACNDVVRDVLCEDNTIDAISQLKDGEGMTPLESCINDGDYNGVRYWVNKGIVVSLPLLEMAIHDAKIFKFLWFKIGINEVGKSDFQLLKQVATEQNAEEVLEIIILFICFQCNIFNCFFQISCLDRCFLFALQFPGGGQSFLIFRVDIGEGILNKLEQERGIFQGI